MEDKTYWIVIVVYDTILLLRIIHRSKMYSYTPVFIKEICSYTISGYIILAFVVCEHCSTVLCKSQKFIYTIHFLGKHRTPIGCDGSHDINCAINSGGHALACWCAGWGWACVHHVHCIHVYALSPPSLSEWTWRVHHMHTNTHTHTLSLSLWSPPSLVFTL